MDIYVLMEDGVVLGVATSESTARDIADRRGSPWGIWRPTEHGTMRTNSPAAPLRVQKIVRVPLAGYLEEAPVEAPPITRDRVLDLKRDIEAEKSRLRWADLIVQDVPKAMPWADPDADLLGDLRRGLDLIRNMPKPEPIKVGPGEALNWLRRGLDQMDTYPSEKALPDTVAARIMGIDVRVDPEMPPNMLRFGSKVFIVDGEVVYEFDETVTPGLFRDFL